MHLDQPSQVLHSLLGHSFQGLEDYDEALKQFTAALDIHDNSSDRNNRALIYLLTNPVPRSPSRRSGFPGYGTSDWRGFPQ